MEPNESEDLERAKFAILDKLRNVDPKLIAEISVTFTVDVELLTNAPQRRPPAWKKRHMDFTK